MDIKKLGRKESVALRFDKKSVTIETNPKVAKDKKKKDKKKDKKKGDKEGKREKQL